MDSKVEEYINKQGSPQKDICLKLKEITINTCPGIKEEMRWGVPTFGIETEDGIYTKYYIGSLKDKVDPGFSIKDLSEEDRKLYEGKGKLMRHIKVFSLDDIDRDRIVDLLKRTPDRAFL
jgi:hypothetical protein